MAAFEASMSESDSILDEIANIDFTSIHEDLEAFHEDTMVQEALQRGVDLHKYGQELDVQLKEAEADTVRQYVSNSEEVGELHKQMQDCDSVLARMQEMLLGFQVDLGGISEEIKFLQDESQSMSVRLKNRRAVEQRLRVFLDNCNIAPEHGEAILRAPVNESFLAAVVAVNKKLKFLLKEAASASSRDHQGGDGNGDGDAATGAGTGAEAIVISSTFAGRKLLPELRRLREKALAKTKDYFAAQFSALRKPKTNVQMVQQNALVKYSELFGILKQECPPVAEELKSVYVESMSRTLLALFKSYFTGLAKLDAKVAPKGYLLAADEGVGLKKGLFSGATKSTAASVGGSADGSSAFSVADRHVILDQIDSEPILLHVAVAESQRYPFEVLLRSVLKHLVDAASSEFLFVLDFFKTNARENFNRIFAKVLSLVLERLETHMLTCFDAVGLLLMIRVCHALRMVMQRRRIPVLDGFFDRISMLLWPRLKNVLEQNLMSLKGADAKKLSRAGLGAHFISRRYGELVASLVVLQGSAGLISPVSMGDLESSSGSGGGGKQATMLVAASLGIAGGGEAMLAQDLSLLRQAMTTLLERLAETFPSVRERRVFLISNFDCILSILQDRKVGMCDEAIRLEDLLMQQKELYTEEELKMSFGKLTSFVVQTEKSVADAQSASGSGSGGSDGGGGGNIGNRPGKLDLDISMVENLVKEFAGSWRVAIQSIHDNVIGYFGDSRNGMEVLKQVLTQMLMYYTRFQELIKRAWGGSGGKTPSFARDIVGTSTILMEIKRYSRVGS